MPVVMPVAFVTEVAGERGSSDLPPCSPRLREQTWQPGYILAAIPLHTNGYLATEIPTFFLEESVKNGHLIVWC